MCQGILFGLLRQLLFVCLTTYGCTAGITDQERRGRARSSGATGVGGASVSALVSKSAIPLNGSKGDYDALIQLDVTKAVEPLK